MYFIENGTGAAAPSGRTAQLQLFPSLVQEHGITPTLYTSAQCSETARKFAKALNVKIVESFPLKPYPCIKCNVSRQTGKKIYHLPFDQQYDRTMVGQIEGERYAETVAEAEGLGFRRAWRWKGNAT